MNAASCEMKAVPVFLLALALILGGCQTTATDEAELRRAWDAATVEIPSVNGDGIWQWYKRTSRLAPEDVDGIWPTVIFMHGCAGGGNGRLGEALVRGGFAVVSPNSLARRNYDGSCIPERHLYDQRRDAIEIRTADLAHAIEQTRRLPWVDARNIFLVGVSEGGGIVAKFRSGDPTHSVRARVIGDQNCNGVGMNAPRSEPVLAILASKDPVYESLGGFNGSCGRFMHSDNGSRNVLYTTGVAHVMHGLIVGYEPSIRLVVEFLREHLVP